MRHGSTVLSTAHAFLILHAIYRFFSVGDSPIAGCGGSQYKYKLHFSDVHDSSC